MWLINRLPFRAAIFERAPNASCTVSRERGLGSYQDSRWPPSPLTQPASPACRHETHRRLAVAGGALGRSSGRRHAGAGARPFRARPISVSDEAGGRRARGVWGRAPGSLSEPRSGGCGTCCRHPCGRRASDASAVAWGWKGKLWRPSGN